MKIAESINVAVILVALAALVLTAHYLSQIRDIAREIRETQKKISERLGISQSKSRLA